MKKICLMLVVVICFGSYGCKKSPPTAPKSAKPAVTQTQPAKEQAAPAVPAAPQAAPAAPAVPAAAPAAAEPAKQALSTTPAAIDMTSPIDTLKEKAKSMSIDALKATAEKYKAQFLSTKSDLATKSDALSKIPMMDKLGPEAQALTKDIQNLTSSLTAIKERLAVYVDALKAQGVDISSFTL